MPRTDKMGLADQYRDARRLRPNEPATFQSPGQQAQTIAGPPGGDGATGLRRERSRPDEVMYLTVLEIARSVQQGIGT